MGIPYQVASSCTMTSRLIFWSARGSAVTSQVVDKKKEVSGFVVYSRKTWERDLSLLTNTDQITFSRLAQSSHKVSVHLSIKYSENQSRGKIFSVKYLPHTHEDLSYRTLVPTFLKIWVQ